MIGQKTSASDGAVAVGGDNSGSIVSVNAGDGTTVALNFSSTLVQKLPSHLGAVVALFAQQGGLAKAEGMGRVLPPEVSEKLQYNKISERHPTIRDWVRHSLVLERIYQGVEQQNPDARYLVRLRAGAIYEEELLKLAKESEIKNELLGIFATENAIKLLGAVTGRMFDDYRAFSSELVELEVALLAVSLIVADAVVECHVLERPENVASS
jgi:hypothetical protein